MLQVVKRVSERRRLHSDLVRILKAEMAKAGTRTVGFPSGNIPLGIHTLGEGRLWAAFSRADARLNASYFNSFGIFEAARSSLDIAVEINVGYEEAANVAGLIATDRATGRAFLLHTGRVAGGYPGVGMRTFLAWSTWSRARLTEVFNDQRLAREGVLIGALSPGLGAKIEDYVNEVAAFKRWVRERDGDVAEIAEQIEEVSRYKREFAGRCRRKETLPVDVEVKHGEVVHALKGERDKVASRNELVFNTPIIDLYVQKGDERTEVYEVKTSTDRQSLYTAIGQLAVHGLSVGVPRLLLVAPQDHVAEDVLRTVKSLNIEVVRYARTRGEYVFTPPVRRGPARRKMP